MTQGTISPALRRKIEETAGHRCGYCLTPQKFITIRLEIDHLIPIAAGGTDDEENLWLACSTCNAFKGTQQRARDPLTGRRVPLFNPRRQKWKRHFRWSDNGVRIIGRTAIGRATVEALQLNCQVRIDARAFWVSVGVFPSKD